ncbi:MAG: glycosyltransferase family 39 protein [Oligoflexia bacterium]|nr:glycosyltransferase family 39 protein [Oligoflexia bacterium]
MSCYILSVILALITHLLFWCDYFRINQIYIFYIYLISVTIPFAYLIINKTHDWYQYRYLYCYIENKKIFFSLLLIAIITRFIFLHNYPFVSVWDPVRDGGLLSQEVAEGIRGNIFGNGPYNGWGRVMLGFTSLSYMIFGPDVLTYRIPAAIVSVLSIIFVYLAILKFTGNSNLGLWGMLIMICSPQHLFFSRSEVLLVITLFMSIIILLQLHRTYLNSSVENYFLSALVLGFSFNFHVSIWPIILFSMIFLFWNLFKAKSKILITLIMLTGIAVFFVIGVGPRIYYLNGNVLKQNIGSTTKIVAIDQIKKIFEDKKSSSTTTAATTIKSNEEFAKKYIKSWLVYFYEKASLHAADPAPLLPFLVGIFFLIGLFYTYFVLKNTFLKILGIFVFLLPLTNSAITDGINYDHRVFVMLPFAIIFAAIGLKLLSRRNILSVIVILSLFYIPYDFFINVKGHKGLSSDDFLVMHTMYLLKDHYPLIYVYDKRDEVKDVNAMIATITDSFEKKDQFLPKMCISASSMLYKHLKKKHVEEQLKYFLYPIEVKIKFDNKIKEDTLSISKKCWGGTVEEMELKIKESYRPCVKYNKWICPMLGDERYKGQYQHLVVEIDKSLISI